MPTILGREVGPIGYGLISHTLGHPANLPSEDQSFEALRTAVELGCVVWNGAEFYGPPNNNSLVLVNRFLTKYPEYSDKVVLNIKGALRPNWVPDSSPEYIRASVENCVKQLDGKARIAMFECGRKSQDVSLETMLNTLGELVKEGKIDSVALTEVNADTIRAAARIVPISAVEIELSIWNTDSLRNGVAEACAELQIPILAYCPLGRGMLTGALKSPEDIPQNDPRRMFPRYQPGNFETNLKLVKEIESLASKKGCTAAQVALGWLIMLSKRPNAPTIIPIPGATSAKHVRENSTVVELTNEEMDAVDAIISSHEVVGDRYNSIGMSMIDQ